MLLNTAALLALATAVVQAVPFVTNPDYLGPVRTVGSVYEEAIKRLEELRYNMSHDWQGDPEIIKPRLPSTCPFSLAPISCAAPANVPAATSAWSLRPGNVDGIISIGDSITAGFAIDSGRLPLGALTEYRGRSWGPGGEDGIESLANFFKVFNPNLKGPAIGTTPSLSKGSYLSAAVSGARIAGIYDQILEVETRLNTEEYQSVRDGWKLWTLMIGANDLCQACNADEADLPERFEAGFRNALIEIRDRAPKSFVAVSSLFNVSRVYLAAQTDIYCILVFPTLGFCPCSDSSSNRAKMDEATAKINKAMERVVAEFDKSDPNFAVVLEPALSEVDIVEYGQKYLSDLDCFHPNRCAHAAFAVGIWNNLFEPAGKKSIVRDPKDLSISCPGPDDVLQ